jgi:hypothetical protein
MNLVLVTGSRDWPDYSVIHNRLQQEPKDTLFLQGGCPDGADRMVEIACQHLGYHYLRCSALWAFGGKPAGPERNEVMVNIALIFGAAKREVKAISFRYGGAKSRGTTGCIKLIKDAKIPLEEFEL